MSLPFGMLALLRTGLVAFVFTTLFLVVAVASRASMPTVRRTGIRGLKRQRAMAAGTVWSEIEPVLRWLGARVRRVVSAQLLDSVDRQISMAGDFLGLYPEELIALSLLSGVLGAAFGATVNAFVHLGPMMLVATAAVGAICPFMTLSSATADRRKAIARRLPPTIDLLALGMGAGLDFPGAVRQVVGRSGTPDDPMIEEMSLVLLGLSLGRTRREALEELAARCPIAMVKEFVGSVVQAELRGNPVADVLLIQAEISRQKRSVLGEEAASKAAVKMIAPLMLLFLAVLILIVAPMGIQLRAQGF